jgi:peptide-methionine (S)-S-oxide reductase
MSKIPGFLARAAGLSLFAALSFLAARPAMAETQRLPPPVVDARASGQTETAVLAGGCFWGVQGVFQHVEGVSAAVSGYAGGGATTAHYMTVGRGDTGHAEAVRLTYDPQKISYGKILQIFLSVVHDPTERDRQGPDVGAQYRSAIFPMTAEQERVAKAYVAQIDRAHVFAGPIATSIEAGKGFYPAEAYHQDFLTNNPDNAYVAINDLPKLEALKRNFPEVYREKPELVAQ